ncbi:undecaprenyl/decaprenyl-phosphate alpha-N-acetylglucosaminyl 1-phosphate transferase [bacterium]|nr:undecaprenyl/decaprenyl-phosphate alpha-N-acetylglucosaminyl 1-phosphate transferase [bacterium]
MNMTSHILGAVIAYIFGMFLVPLVIDFSKKEGLVDVPNERKIHTKPISRIGGVAIFLSVMLTFLSLVILSYYPHGKLLSGVLLGSSLMFLLGFVDDIYNLNAKTKLFLQISIATVAYLLGISIDTLPFIGDIGAFSYIVTILWIVGISNALNFIDGVDGLAGTITAIGAITLSVIAITVPPANTVIGLIGFVLVGAMLAFLCYNYNPARIFMGDSGALFSGFLLAAISVTGVMKTATLTIFVIAPLVLAVPIIDITFSSLRRIAKCQSPFVADDEHIHHKLLHAGFSQKSTVGILASVAIVFSSVAALILGNRTEKYFVISITVIVAIMVLFNIFILLTKKK